MKNVISGLVAIDEQAAVTDAPGKKFFKKINTYDLLSHVTSAESFYNDFIEMVREHPEYFEYLPIIKPVSDECIITARFGKKKDPFTGEIKWHNGIDFSGERETPVFAAASGTVEMVQDHNFWGRRIRIGHRFGFSTVYAHLGTVYACQGKNVKKGEVIGTIGLSGMTVGPHLHYEVHHNDSAVDAGNFFFPDTLSVAYTPAH